MDLIVVILFVLLLLRAPRRLRAVETDSGIVLVVLAGGARDAYRLRPNASDAALKRCGLGWVPWRGPPLSAPVLPAVLSKTAGSR